jgi:rSAM/selenodomain-associated transferase 1
MSPTRILIFAKAPRPGLAKTRLVPALGAAGAARLAERMLIHTLEAARAANIGPVELCAEPVFSDPAWRGFELPPDMSVTAQGPGDLGARMARAAKRCIDRHEHLLLIGIDCPALDAQALRDAALMLETHQAVMHPAHDGGYVLLGLAAYDASLFSDIPWSTPRVAALTHERLTALGWRNAIGRTLADIDEPADLERLPPDWLARMRDEAAA